MASSLRPSPWPCSRCTFLNPPSRLFSCQLCQSPSSPSSSSSSAKWACNACTLQNPQEFRSCQACETLRSDLKMGSLELPVIVLDDDLPGAKKRSREEFSPFPSENVGVRTRLSSNIYKILSYNVWFREDLHMVARMNAIGGLIQQHSPDIICLQEVTPNIYKVFQASAWWNDYACSVPWKMATEKPYFCMQLSKLPVKSFRSEPFNNTIMGRELCIADIDTGPNKPLVVATTHLESPCPGPPKWDQMYSKERVAQAKYSTQILHELQNVVFCGDMNWDDKLDGEFPAPASWVDAWAELRPDEEGFTYDTKSNLMLSENKKLQRRLDRFICKLQDFEVTGIEMVGVEPMLGFSYQKEKRVRKEMKTLELAVLPSDHFGLLLTIRGN
ncbi:uncharacterized protein LOC144700961 [Wolffia australiana]